MGGFYLLHNRAQRFLGLLRLKTALAIVAAEFNQHPLWFMLLKQCRQACQTLVRGIAANAGVHHRDVRLPFIIQQRRPGCIGRHAIARAKAVAKH